MEEFFVGGKHSDWNEGEVLTPSNATPFEAEIDGVSHLFMPPDTSLRRVDRLAREWLWGVVTIRDGEPHDYGAAVMIPRTATRAEIIGIYRADCAALALPESCRLLARYGKLVHEREGWHAKAARDLGVRTRDVDAWMTGGERPPEWLSRRLSGCIARVSEAGLDYDDRGERTWELFDELEGFMEPLKEPFDPSSVVTAEDAAIEQARRARRAAIGRDGR